MPPPITMIAIFWGVFAEWVREDVPAYPGLNPLHPPLRLPGRIPEIQGLGGRRGRGACGRQLYCHTCAARSPLEGGNAARFFLFVFSVSGPVSFALFLSFLLSKGRFFGKIFGSELLFLGGCVGFCVFGGFLLLFLLYFLAFRSRNCLEKFSSCQVWFFSGFVLSSLGFFSSSSSSFSVFVLFFSFSRDKVQVVTGHPRTRTCFLVLFLFCVPPLLSVPPVLAVRPASWRFCRGAILGPGGFWDSPWTF